MDDTDGDPQALRERVRELEERLDQLEPPGYSRRSVLASATAAAGAGALGVYSAVQPATAQASGTIGSDDDRANWYVYDIDAISVSTSQVNDSAGTPTLGESVASGSVTLSSGEATIDTGVGVGTTATFYVALGPDTDDADVAADIRAQSGGNYEVDIQETDTDVGTPTVNYDVVRVR